MMWRRSKNFPLLVKYIWKCIFDTFAFIGVVIVQTKGPVTLEPTCRIIDVIYVKASAYFRTVIRS